eukprot:COSAG06_NODE_2289_length_7148_cov_2.086679_9_plen_74_part_00
MSVSLHRWWWLPRVRAWLQLLIMDECTASVDVQTDQKIQVSARAKETPPSLTLSRDTTRKTTHMKTHAENGWF